MAGLLISGISLGGGEGHTSVDGTQLRGVCVSGPQDQVWWVSKSGCVVKAWTLPFDAREMGAGQSFEICVHRTARNTCNVLHSDTREGPQNSSCWLVVTPSHSPSASQLAFPVTSSPQLKARKGDKSFLSNTGLPAGACALRRCLVGEKQKRNLQALKCMLEMHAQLPLNFQLKFQWHLQTEGLPHASLVYI